MKEKKIYLRLKQLLKKREYQLIIGIFLLSSIFIGLINYLIVVQESQKKIVAFARNASNVCQRSNDWRNCYSRELAKVNKKQDLNETLSALKEVNKIDPKTRDCHILAHGIASSEVEKDPQKWIDIFNYVDQTTCTNGFIHGVLEGRSKFDSSLVLDKYTIPQICEQIDLKTSPRIGQAREAADDACAHIIGHILLAQEDAVVKKAVDTCATLHEGIRNACFDGVFMENITRDNLESHEVAKKFALTKSAAIGLEENCKKYSGDEGLSCWRELAHIYAPITNNNPLEVHTLCYQSPHKEYAQECYLHAINSMITFEKYSGVDLTNTCKPYFENEAETNQCIARSLSPLLGSSVEFIDRADIFCNAVPEQNKHFCYSRIGEELKRKTSYEKRKILCQKIPEVYVNLCLKEK
jgi:hypothetical protein